MCDFNSSEEKFVSDHSNIAVIPCILKFPGLLLVRYRICPPGPLVTLRSNQILILSRNSQSRGCVYVSLTLWQVRMRGSSFSLLGGVANPQNLQSATLSADWRFFRSVAPYTQSNESPSYKANGSPSPTATPEGEFASLEGWTKKQC